MSRTSKPQPETISPATESRWYRPYTSRAESGIEVFVRAKPQARQSRIREVSADALVVELAAMPKEGEANDELVDYFSDIFSLRKSMVVLVSGETSRVKRVRLVSMSESDFISAINKILDR